MTIKGNLLSAMFPCCAIEGDGLYEGLDWLTTALQKKEDGTLDNANMSFGKTETSNQENTSSDGSRYFTKGWDILKRMFTQ
jgi:hypothetical protein